MAEEVTTRVVVRVASRLGSAFVADCLTSSRDDSHEAVRVTPERDSMSPDAVTHAAAGRGPVSVVNPPSNTDDGVVAETFQDIAIPKAGLVAILGTAGTGKSTALTVLAEHIAQSRPVERILYMEPDAEAHKVIVEDRTFASTLASALGRASSGPVKGAIAIDSLRAWVTLGTGFESRLGSGGWDLTMFPALTQLDIAAKQLGVLVIAAVYIEAMQIGASDPGNDAKLAAMMQLLLRSMDGSTTTAVLMGPTPNQRGHFFVLTRLRTADGQSLRAPNPTAGFLQLAVSPVSVADLTITPTTSAACWDLQGHGADWAKRVAKVVADQHDDPVKQISRFSDDDFSGEGRAKKLLEISGAVRPF